MRTSYLTTSSVSKLSLPKGTRKRSLVGRSDSIRSKGIDRHHAVNYYAVACAASPSLKLAPKLYHSGLILYPAPEDKLK